MEKSFSCKICNNIRDNITFTFDELLHRTFDSFEYVLCPSCGCLQRKNIVNNIANYYPNNYYSFKSKGTIKEYLENRIIANIINYEIGGKNSIGKLAKRYKEHWDYYVRWIDDEYISKESKILDIGCGNGVLLKQLKIAGFTNLFGVDPYISENIIHKNIIIEKKDIYNLSEKFDFIMLHHSFEHMEEPHTVLEKLSSLLNDSGTILIRIPVIDSYVWNHYEEKWFQIDAPRHSFIYSIKGIHYLCQLHKLKVDRIFFDSTSKQFLYSERYKRGLAIDDTSFNYTKKENLYYREKAELLNDKHEGDQACFYIKKI
jgi:2-polyprenyl-3-methyl-5-hydroxy-6-metoxy-1,4-benzoquinol methylase